MFKNDIVHNRINILNLRDNTLHRVEEKLRKLNVIVTYKDERE